MSTSEQNVTKAAKKVHNFKQRGNVRGKKAIAAINAVGTLANRKIHTWDDAQVDKLFSALQSKLDDARGKFTKTDEPILTEDENLI